MTRGSRSKRSLRGSGSRGRQQTPKVVGRLGTPLGSWNGQQNKLNEYRKEVVQKIVQQRGVPIIVKRQVVTHSVPHPNQ